MTHSHTIPTVNERNLILTVGLIQFVNILDFMMVMPLGPDFAVALNIPVSEIGIIGGVYTFAAAIAGLIAALYMDQFARKKAALFCLAGLSIATFAGALAWDRESMLAARVFAGMFGGPLTSLLGALIADYIPPERRGRAMGKVAGAFSAASVLGVPFGLELASRISWHAPFVATGTLALGVLVLTYYALPYHKPFIEMHDLRTRLSHFAQMLRSRRVLAALSFMMIIMMSAFMIIPNIASHVQLNQHFPREDLGGLYFFGGLVSFFSMRGSGWLTDKTSTSLSAVLFTATLVLTLLAGFVWYHNPIPVVVIFVLFMVSMSGRMVAVQTLNSKIPLPAQRGAFMSVQSAVMHMGSAIGAYLSSQILVEEAGALLHIERVATIAVAMSLVVPIFIWGVERSLKQPR